MSEGPIREITGVDFLTLQMILEIRTVRDLRLKRRSHSTMKVLESTSKVTKKTNRRGWDVSNFKSFTESWWSQPDPRDVERKETLEPKSIGR